MYDFNLTLRNLLDYCGVGSPCQIRWAHAVNTREALAKYCFSSSDRVHAVEGDISWWRGVLVMAHGPQPPQEANLTFKEWIEAVACLGKLAKLDFKDPRALLPCLTYLQKAKLEIPIFLNADVLLGPGGSLPLFGGEEFLKLCGEHYPAGILSLGWATGSSSDGGKKYTRGMISSMLALTNPIKTLITFPIRVNYLKASYEVVRLLLKKSNHTVTLWNGSDERVSLSLRNWLRESLDHGRFFCDYR